MNLESFMKIRKDFLTKFSSLNETLICYNLDLLNDIILEIKEDLKDLNNIKVLYVVKSNGNEQILNIIHENGIGFDFASEEEFNLLKIKSDDISITGTYFSNLFIKKCMDLKFLFDFNSKNQLVKFLEEYGVCFENIGVRLSVNGSRFGFFIKDFDFLKKFRINRIHVHYGNKNIENTKNILKYLTNCILNYKAFCEIDCINLGGGLENIYLSKNKGYFLELIEKFRVDISKILNKNINLILEPGDLISGFIGFVNPNIIEFNENFAIINISRLNFSLWKDIGLVYPKKNTERKLKIFGNSCFENDYFGTYDVSDHTEKIILFPVSSYNFNITRTIHERKSPKVIYYKNGIFYE